MTDKSVSKAGQSKVLRIGLLGVAVLALGACSNIHSSTGTYDPRFMNYDQRHALSLRQQEATLPLLVGANATGLTSGDRTALSGFMQSYAAQGEGALRIRVPQGSANAHAAITALAISMMWFRNRAAIQARSALNATRWAMLRRTRRS
jgi:type IV pilus biogenesis protein CpaD/CtpE